MTHTIYDYYATRHTRRKPGAQCCDCECRIMPGESYLCVRNLERSRRNRDKRPIANVCDSCFSSYEGHEQYVTNSPCAKAEKMSSRYEREKDQAVLAAAEWNRTHPVGSTVTYEEVIGLDKPIHTTTKTEAYVAASGIAVIFLHGVSGHVALSHCKKSADKNTL